MTAPPAFPDSPEFARAFYDVAVCHLQDVRILYREDRYAASVTSAMKAAELGIKAALILQNAMGLYDKMFGTHKPLTSVDSHPLLKRLIIEMDIYHPDLSVGIRGLESLEPQPFGKGNFEVTAEANTEYPFLEKFLDASGIMTTRLWTPYTYFTGPMALSHYRVAYESLEALAGIYPTIRGWGKRLPRRL